MVENEVNCLQGYDATMMTGNEVKLIRVGNGMTRYEFAKALGVSWRTVESWEHEWRRVRPGVERSIRMLESAGAVMLMRRLSAELITKSDKSKRRLAKAIRHQSNVERPKPKPAEEPKPITAVALEYDE